MAKTNQFISELKIAYFKKSKQHGITLIEKAFDEAYNGNSAILIALLKKILPDKIQGEGFDSKQYIQIFEKYTPGELRGLVDSLRKGISEPRTALDT